MARANDETKELLLELTKYVEHKDGCTAWPQFTGHFTSASRVGECDCGLNKALITALNITRDDSVTVIRGRA
jgi:hypothetical protein